MKRTTKTFIAIAVAAFACGFYNLQSSSKVICGNVEALTDGDAVSFIKHDAKTFDETSTKARTVREVKHGFCQYLPANTEPDGKCWEVVVKPE